MNIDNVYRPTVSTCAPDEALEAAARRMERSDTGVLVVMDGAVMAGVITERDIVRAVANSPDPRGAPVVSYATADVVTARPGEDTAVVARRMLSAGVRRLPVVDSSNELVGIVSMRDLLSVEILTSLPGRGAEDA